MEIIRIFAEELCALYAVKYEGVDEDELKRLLNCWSDIEFLENFFEENKINLAFFELDVEAAVKETLKYVKEIEKALSAKELPLFVTLNNTEYKEQRLSKQKHKRKWLRFYAIKIENNTFLITGGAIKLTHLMEDAPHTQKELEKLTQCRDFLTQNGVFDKDSFDDFFELAF